MSKVLKFTTTQNKQLILPVSETKEKTVVKNQCWILVRKHKILEPTLLPTIFVETRVPCDKESMLVWIIGTDLRVFWQHPTLLVLDTKCNMLSHIPSSFVDDKSSCANNCTNDHSIDNKHSPDSTSGWCFLFCFRRKCHECWKLKKKFYSENPLAFKWLDCLDNVVYY